MNMVTEMRQYWENDSFWDQVMVGYTDLSSDDLHEHFSNMDMNKDACDLLAEHLKDVDVENKVQWKCKDVWAGNADDFNMKKMRKNKHQ